MLLPTMDNNGTTLTAKNAYNMENRPNASSAGCTATQYTGRNAVTCTTDKRAWAGDASRPASGALEKSMRYEFKDLVDLKQLQGLLQTFSEVAGVASALVDPAGNVLTTEDGYIVGAGWKRICLDFHRGNPSTAARCRQSDIELSKGISSGGATLACHTCSNGLVDAARPVIIDGRHMVSLFTGQFLLEPPNVDFFRQQAKEFGFDEAAYLEALKEVPVLSREFVDKTLMFLDQLAKTIAEMGMHQKQLLHLNQELRGGLAEAQQIAGLGSWVKNVEADHITLSDELYRIFGLSRGEFDGTYRSFLEVVHPDDREAVHQAYTASLAEGGRYANEFRIIRHLDGLVRWGYARCEHERDPDGKILRSVGTFLDITDRKRAERKLEEAKLAADEANRAKSRFLAAASHDLRQPLQALSLYHQALANDLPAAKRPLMARIESCAALLTEQLNDLLDLSKLDAGVMAINTISCPINDIVSRVVAATQEPARAKGIELRHVSSTAIVETDPHLMERLLLNLVSNAVKYTLKGGVLVGCRRRQNGRIRVEVCDTGIGIEKEHLQAIFDEFYQVGNSERDREKGSGLGLAIVDRIARLLGAPVIVQSRPGVGSTFAVDLRAVDLRRVPI